jgi:GNAT superfamily N-acetyltransferase
MPSGAVGGATLGRMLPPAVAPPRQATVADAVTVARLLDAFNREYVDPTPGVDVLAERLTRLLAGGDVIALLAGDPATGLAVLTLRPNVWYDGPVALLDELYVVPQLRGRGTGAALLAAVEHVTRAHGGDLVEINVDGDDDGARRFYERHGYRNHEPGEAEASLYYYYRELPDPSAQHAATAPVRAPSRRRGG